MQQLQTKNGTDDLTVVAAFVFALYLGQTYLYSVSLGTGHASIRHALRIWEIGLLMRVSPLEARWMSAIHSGLASSAQADDGQRIWQAPTRRQESSAHAFSLDPGDQCDGQLSNELWANRLSRDWYQEYRLDLI